jgi:hypothetical protein
MHLTRVTPLLCSNRTLRKAESPESGEYQAQEESPEVPSAPDETRNSEY